MRQANVIQTADTFAKREKRKELTRCGICGDVHSPKNGRKALAAAKERRGKQSSGRGEERKELEGTYDDIFTDRGSTIQQEKSLKSHEHKKISAKETRKRRKTSLKIFLGGGAGGSSQKRGPRTDPEE